MASRSATGILFRQLWQIYFGLFDGTYIFVPQAQKVKPAKS